MKLSQKILLSTLSLAFVALSLDAAKRSRDDDEEQQPAAPKAQQLVVGQTAASQLDALCRSAQAALNTHFPILLTGAGPSTPPQITADQQHGLRQAAGTLKIISAQLTALTARRATRMQEAILRLCDKLADDCITAIQSVVLSARRELTELAAAIDAYNDARSRTATATGEPVPRLRDAAITNERGQFRYTDDEIAAYDACLADLCMVGDIPIAASTSAASSTEAQPFNVPLAEGEYACAICLDEEVTTEANPHVWLGCCNNKFHKSCLIPQFTKTINTLGVPECALCRKKIGTPPAELVGAVPTVDALNLLFTGAFNGSTAFVQRALDMGLNVNTKKPANPEDDEYDGCTALHIAVDQSHSDVVALLLAHGAEVTATDATGWTPIHYAAMQPGGACLRQLITHGQSLGIEARNLKTPNNKLPLHIAVEYNNIENVRILLGTDNLHINTTTALKNTSLMLAATDSHMHDAMQTLLATPGIDINATNQYGNTALIIAAHRGYTLIVQKLIASGADINAVDALGHTALMVAKTEEIKAILRHAGAV